MTFIKKGFLAILTTIALVTGAISPALATSSSDASLHDLAVTSQVGQGYVSMLDPVFSPERTHYTIAVDSFFNANEQLTFTATGQANATATYEYGSLSGAFSLNAGNSFDPPASSEHDLFRTLTISVNAQNGDVKTYNIDIYVFSAPSPRLVSLGPNKASVYGGGAIIATVANIPLFAPIPNSTGCRLSSVTLGDRSAYSVTYIDQDPVTGYSRWSFKPTSLDRLAPESVDVKLNTQCGFDARGWGVSRSASSITNNAFTYVNPHITSAEIPDSFTLGTGLILNGDFSSYYGYTLAYLIDPQTGSSIEFDQWGYSGPNTTYFYIDPYPSWSNGTGNNTQTLSPGARELVVYGCNSSYVCDKDHPLAQKTVKWLGAEPQNVTFSPSVAAPGSYITVRGIHLDTDDDPEIYFGNESARSVQRIYSAYEDGNTYDEYTKKYDVYKVQVPTDLTPGTYQIRVQNYLTYDYTDIMTLANGTLTISATPTITSVSPRNVATSGGAVVEITGTNFGKSGTPTVTIGGSKAGCVTRVSSTKLLASVPFSTQTGAADVNVILPLGSGATLNSGTVNYVNPGTAPTISSATPKVSIVDGGGEGVIRGVNLGSGTSTGVTVGGKCATITSVSSSSISFEFPAADAAGAASVVVSTPQGSATKSGAVTYKASDGITSVSPNRIATSAPATSITISGVGFGASGKVVVGSQAAQTYSKSNGTQISGIHVNPGNLSDGTLSIKVTPTGAAKPFETTIQVYAPEITYVGMDPQSANYSAYDINKPQSQNYMYTTAATGGETLLVKGSGFGTSGTLKIGGLATGTTSWSDSSISFVVPQLAVGQYEVEVVPHLGIKTATRLQAFSATYVWSGLPGISSIVEDPAVGSLYPSSFSQTSDPNDVYFIYGHNFLGTNAGATTTVTETRYNSSDDGVQLSIVSITDDLIKVHLNRAFGSGWKAFEVKTNVGSTRVNYGVEYLESMPSSGVNIAPNMGYCGPTAVTANRHSVTNSAPTYNPTSVNLTTFGSADFGNSGQVQLIADGNSIDISNDVSYTSSGISFDFTNQSLSTLTGLSVADPIWGNVAFKVTPDDTQLPPVTLGFSCRVSPTVATELTFEGTTYGNDAQDASVSVPAGSSYVMSIGDYGFVGTDAFTPSQTGDSRFEFIKVSDYNPSYPNSGYVQGLPSAAGEYYVRVRVTGSDYDTSKYQITSAANKIDLTIQGFDIAVTPKLYNSAATSLTYRGTLSDGSANSSHDYDFAVTSSGAHAATLPLAGNYVITSVEWQYRNHDCSTGNWASGLPSTVAPETCSGPVTSTPGTWDVRVSAVHMTHGDIDYANYFNLTNPIFSLTINPKSLTITSVATSKYYDGNDHMPLFGLKVTGLIDGDDVAVSDATEGTMQGGANAQTGAVSLPSIVLSGSKASNYTITAQPTSVTGVIRKGDATLTLTSSTSAVVMGTGMTVTVSHTTVDARSGTSLDGNFGSTAGISAVVVTSTTPSKCSVDSNGTVTPLAAGTCTIKAVQGSSTNYNASKAASDSSSTAETVDIAIFAAAKTPTVVVDDLVVPETDAQNGVSFSASAVGLIGSDSLSGPSAYTVYDSANHVVDYQAQNFHWTQGKYSVVASGASVNAATPAAYTNQINYVKGTLVITPAPPVINTVSPRQGPEAGGTTITITGTRLNTVTSLMIGGHRIKKANFVVNPDGTSLTFRSPAGFGTVPVTLTAGLNDVSDSFTYIPPANPVTTFTAVAAAKGSVDGGSLVTLTGSHFERVTEIHFGGVTIYPNDFTVSSDGTSIVLFTPPGKAGKAVVKLITATQQPVQNYAYVSNASSGKSDLLLNLALKVAVGNVLSGGQATLKGGGLQANSKYTLTMHSSPINLYSGVSDGNGNFTSYVRIPAKACRQLGKHELILEGTAPDGTHLRDIQYIVLDHSCVLIGSSHKAPVKSIKASGFLFDYNSYALTEHAKSVLRGLLPLLKQAKSVTVTGYTQTDLTSAASIRANKILALNRSRVVRDYLRAHGVTVSVTVIGKGPVEPVSKKLQKLNRRVVIVASYLAKAGN